MALSPNSVADPDPGSDPGFGGSGSGLAKPKGLVPAGAGGVVKNALAAQCLNESVALAERVGVGRADTGGESVD